jgi:large subunit ribosomal protein L21
MKSGLHLIRQGSSNLRTLRQQSSSILQRDGLGRLLLLQEQQHQTPATLSSSLIRLRKECFSSEASSTSLSESRFAVVDHSDAYEASLQGPHGHQLALARLEGLRKDDPAFDPFLEDELAELKAQAGDDDVDDEVDIEEYEDEKDTKKYGSDVREAEYVDGEEDDDHDDDEDDDEEDEGAYDEREASLYNRDGSVRRKKSVLATLRAGFPGGGLFAVIELGGVQHKVTTDDLIVVSRLKPVDHYKIGSVHTLQDVLLVGSSHKTLVGIPTVPGAEVDFMVEEITRDAKVIIFKKRRRKNSQRKNGFRRDITMLRVLDIRMPEAYKDHKHVSRDIVSELESASELMASNSQPQPTKFGATGLLGQALKASPKLQNAN